MTSPTRPVVLVTGCGHGLGLAITHQLLSCNAFTVIATARINSLVHLRKQFQETENFKIYELDITSEESRHALLTQIYREFKRIDVLINNAGISYRSVIEHMDEESELHQLNTNYLGPMALIRSVLPSMREQGSGKIINISSVSGMMAMPTMGSYSASKHALEGATEALWYEMRPFGIDVCLVQPGFIHSDSYKNVYYPNKARLSEALEGPYADYYQSIAPFIAKIMSLSSSTPDKVAQKILKIIGHKNPPLWIPVTGDSTLFFFLRKIIPRSIFHGLMNAFLPNSNHWGSRFTKANQKRIPFR